MADTHRVFVDGVEDAPLPHDDPGFTRGYTAFETLRTYGEAPFRLPAHLDRLEASCEAMALACPPRAQVRAEIEVVAAEDVWIRYTLTGGGRRVVEVRSIDRAYIGRPRAVASVVMEPSPFLPGFVKHGSRAAWNVASRRAGVEEILLVDRQGMILEGNRSNVLAVLDGTLTAPPDDGRRLQGVTMGAILEAAARAGLPTARAELPLDADFDEIYLSSTLKELAPITAVDGREVGGGPVGEQALEAFRRLVARECGGGWANEV